jgi:hypothetical protein
MRIRRGRSIYAESATAPGLSTGRRRPHRACSGKALVTFRLKRFAQHRIADTRHQRLGAAEVKRFLILAQLED